MNIADYSASNIICNIYSHKTPILEDFSTLPRPYYTFAYILCGSLECTCGNEITLAQKGDVLFIPYKIKYRLYWATPGTSVCSCHFNFPAFSQPFGNKSFELQKISGFEGLCNDFLFIHKNINSESSALGVLGTFYKICDQLFPYLQYQEEHQPDARIRKAIDYIQNNFRKNITIEELAKLCGFSESHFHSIFKKEVGIPAIEYKNSLCIRHAAMLLLDTNHFSIEEISTECGFQSAEYFRRVFKSFMGVSPKEYRNSMKKTI